MCLIPVVTKTPICGRGRGLFIKSLAVFIHLDFTLLTWTLSMVARMCALSGTARYINSLHPSPIAERSVQRQHFHSRSLYLATRSALGTHWIQVHWLTSQLLINTFFRVFLLCIQSKFLMFQFAQEKEK